jgi:hypothetical protein
LAPITRRAPRLSATIVLSGFLPRRHGPASTRQHVFFPP